METEPDTSTSQSFTPKTAPRNFHPFLVLGLILLVVLALFGGLYMGLKATEPTPMVFTEVPSASPIIKEATPTVIENKLQQYTNETYGFSFMYPADWQVTEEFPNNIKMQGPNNHVLSIGYKRQDEKVRLTPTGTGAGEFVEKGTVNFKQLTLSRDVLVSPNGVETDVFYNKGLELSTDGKAFVFILSINDPKETALDPSLQKVADSIIASFTITGISPTIKQ